MENRPRLSQRRTQCRNERPHRLHFAQSAQTGITFSNRLADASIARNRIYEIGSGVALGDVDGDGWCDIYFCRSEGDNVLYRNLGDWKFEDITDKAGVACPNQYSTGAVLADVDGDGDLDLLVNAIGKGTRAFLNDGKGHFHELTASGLVRRFGSTSMALADIDGDGDLDLYVTNYRTDTYKDRPPGLNVEGRMENGKLVVSPADRFIPLMQQLGRPGSLRIGRARFVVFERRRQANSPPSPGPTAPSSTKTANRSPTRRKIGASRDVPRYEPGRRSRLYICNDFFYSRDRVWLNKQGQGFKAIGRTALRNIESLLHVDRFCRHQSRRLRRFSASGYVSRDHAYRQRNAQT